MHITRLVSIFIFMNMALPAQNRIKVACVGDSVTYGYGLSDLVIIHPGLNDSPHQHSETNNSRPAGFPGLTTEKT